MKNNVFMMLFIAVFFASVSCNEAKKEEQKIEEPAVTETKAAEPEKMAMAEYQCPMKCEQEKSYAESGNCPVCKMELKELAAASGEAVHDETNH
ncbi:MAG: heavy metal-binding domain-containing protein [Flavobacteriaceae bacterium]|nr:heavy metal-binding domain-containing protein [Flavobacteriaceae bacterium]